jgi:glutathione synthase/RimK-type ligase-like ATP-grasp enzyme
MESTMVLRNPGQFTTIYRPKTVPLPTRSFTEINEQIMAGLRVIPTLLLDATWQQYDDARLQAEMASLGGFPVVVKRLGLSHGQGVQKVDDPAALRTLLQDTDFTTANAIARQYLPDYRHYRLIVVADEVVAAIEYHVPADDFRTNAAEPVVTAVAVDELSQEMQQMAVASVQLRASILGGVDILVDQTDGVAYLAEANVPCYFARAEGPTGIDVGGLLVDALLAKQQLERAS